MFQCGEPSISDKWRPEFVTLYLFLGLGVGRGYGCRRFSFSYVRVCVLSHFSHVQLFSTPRTVARQAPLSMEFSRQEYWTGLLCPPPGDLPHPGIETASLVSLALAGGFFGGFFTSSASWEALFCVQICLKRYLLVLECLLLIVLIGSLNHFVLYK